MSKLICTLEAMQYAAEIKRSVRFRYVVDVKLEIAADQCPEDARNIPQGDTLRVTGASIVPEDAPDYDRRGQAAFAIMHDGQTVAFDNVCPHRNTELDWNPGDVFDETGLYLICATHGAMFEPQSGLCVAGPCTKQRLRKVDVVVTETGVFLA
jgi:nitrite reductase/ring-hydroxylating ferredoxin subunit